MLKEIGNFISTLGQLFIHIGFWYSVYIFKTAAFWEW